MDIATTYNEEMQGWASEPMMLDGDAWLNGALTEKGYLTILKSEDGENWERALTSHRADEFRFCVYGSTKYPWMMIVASTEPKNLEYERV